MMNPSMLPLASISMLRTSLSKESSDTNDYAVSVFIGNLFYAIDDSGEKIMNNLVL
jgi:hypothetical protein